MSMQKVTPFLWFDSQAEEAAKLYVSLFDDSEIEDVSDMSVSFRLAGQPFIALNGGPHFKFTEAISLSVTVSMLAETIGISRRIWGVSQVWVEASLRLRIDERRGTNKTSSNVRPVTGLTFINPPDKTICFYCTISA